MNPATVNKVGLGNDDNLYIRANARFKVGSAVNSLRVRSRKWVTGHAQKRAGGSRLTTYL